MNRLTIRATIAAGMAAVMIGAFNVSAPAAQAVETCDGQTPTIVGTLGDDTLTGTAGDDVIAGLGGSDTIQGLDGNDSICADP